VLVHCVDAVSRTPTVAALYAARHVGIPVQQALRNVRAVLPAAQPNPAFMAALDRFGTTVSPLSGFPSYEGSVGSIAPLFESAVALREWNGGCEDD
jgi:hypothetical protein